MKVLRDYGLGVGALLVALGLILRDIVPEKPLYTGSITVVGGLLLVVGIVLNRARIGAMLRGRAARAAGVSLGYTLLVVAVVILINFLAGRHHRRFDLTENHDFSLSEQTIKVLGALPREVSVTSFSRETDPGRT